MGCSCELVLSEGPMSVATIDSKAWGNYFPLLRLLVVAVSCSLLMGCATSSPEDDYVTGILADAMQGASGGDVASSEQTIVTPAPEPVPVTPAAIVSAPPIEVAPLPAPTVVSVPPPALVSVPPSTTVSVPVAKTVVQTVAVPAVISPEAEMPKLPAVVVAPSSN